MFLRYNIFSLFFFNLILIGCLLPGNNLPESGIRNLDKIAHVTLFFLFSFSAIIGFIKQNQYPKLHFDAVKYVVGISTFMAIFTELLQHFVIPIRSFEIFDIIADFVGILLALCFFLYVRGNKKCGY